MHKTHTHLHSHTQSWLNIPLGAYVSVTSCARKQPIIISKHLYSGFNKCGRTKYEREWDTERKSEREREKVKVRECESA